MEEDLNILVNKRRPQKCYIKKPLQPKTNKSRFVYDFKEQNSTVTSWQPEQHNNQKCMAQFKKPNQA